MSNKIPLRPMEILLIEDNPGDVRLAQEAIQEGKLHNRMWFAADGEEAMRFLHREGVHAKAPRPDLILLDLNLPHKDGSEVLAEIKADPRLRRIPVVVLTTSQAEEDILRAYDLHANCYVHKPIDFDQFVRIVQGIQEFWFCIVQLPPDSPHV